MLLKLFVIVLVAAVVFGDTATSYPPPTTTPPPPPATTSDNHTTAPAPTTKPDNKTTTVVPTTKPDNKTTTAVPTTKPDNKTTTAVPTTKPDNKTTAPVPTTKPDNETTTPMTTPKPTTPPPPPPHGNFSLKENGSYCLLAQFAASITIHYVEVIYFTNSSNITKDASLTQHVNRTTEHDIKISGDCGRKGNKAKLILSWPKKDSFYELTMDIDKVVAASASGNKTSWSVAKITFNVTVKGNPDFKNATVTEPFVLSIYNKSTGNPRGQVGENYFCKDDVPVSFENDKKDFNVDSMFEDLRIEPFVNKTGSSDFGNTLAVWSKVAALNEGSIITVSPSNGATDSSSMLSTHLSMSATATTMAPSPNTTVTPSPNSTVTPSPNTTTMPSPNSTVTPSPNTTTMPSPNSTVTPSPNMTATSLHSLTIMPHNNTVTPSHSMTIMPSSAHSVMPTSSAHPTPPSPNWGNFSVKDENNTTCLIANMGALFNIKNGSKESTIKLPVNASSSGACAKNSSEPYITLQWHTPEGSCNFTMHFGVYANKKENLNAASSKRWAAANLSFSLETEDGAGMFTFHSAPEILKQLSADLGSSYECLTSATDFLLMADNNSSVNVSLIHIQFQPFEVQGGHLSKAEVCATPAPTTHSPSGKTTVKPPKKSESHVVAIAVGCSLAGLVVIVIVGYVIGRRRSRSASQGYRKL